MFDPYLQWLGIPDAHRPPNADQLLGIRPGERDRAVIEAAAAERSARVRSFEATAPAGECARILAEIAEAKATLLDPERRLDADAPSIPDILTDQSRLAPRPRGTPSAARRVLILGIVGLVFFAGLWRWNRRPPARPEGARPAPIAAPRPKPTADRPAVFRVTVEPAEADLRFSGRGVTSARRGDRWEVTVAGPDGDHPVTIEAKQEGYQPWLQQVFPAAGERREIALRLVPIPPPVPPPAPVIAATPAPAEVKVEPPAASQAVALPPAFPARLGDRTALVKREGGSVESEKAVARGLDWLARHQRPDGSWSLDHHSQCRIPGCPTDKAMHADTAATGLALLAFLGAGNIHTEDGPYREAVRRALDWLATQQRPDGHLTANNHGMPYTYSFAIDLLARSEAYGMSHDPKLRAPIERSVKLALHYQKAADGGWRYDYGNASDTSVSGWFVSALHTARLVGLEVPDEAFERYGAYLDKAATDSWKSSYAYQPGGAATPAMTAVALLDRHYLGWSRDFPSLVRGARLVLSAFEASNERNVYYWYNATLLLHHVQGKLWQAKSLKVLRDGLILTQVGGNGCDRGSWHPLRPIPDRWGKDAGRLYQTALSLLILEVYYRYPPLDRQDSAPAPAPLKVAAPPSVKAKRDRN